MLNIGKFIGKFVKNSSDRELGSLKTTIKKINELEAKIKEMPDENFPAKTAELKSRVQNGEKLESLIPESFAYVREAAWRTLGERHYDVQLMGGIILHQGKISEMKTGEGKTLVSTLPVYLNALTGKGVHIVTVNEYLAKRDSEWMGQIYNFLGLSVGCITNDMDDIVKKKNYNCDVTYGTNSEFGFDYLRDNMKYGVEQMVQRDHYFCIVDEVDSILIDEARTPLVISGGTEDKSDQYFVSNKFIKQLEKNDYELDEKNKNVMLSEKGIDKIEKLSQTYGILKNNNFYDPQNINLVHHVNQALKANLLFSKDVDYIVRDNKVQIIDEFTGRVLEGRRFSDGLHQAIEQKEGVPKTGSVVQVESVDYSKFGETYSSELSRIQQVGAKNLYASWLNVPHVTQHDKVDVTDLESFRETLNVEAEMTGQKITPLAFIVRACCLALEEYPIFNSSLESNQQSVLINRFYNIGFAVDTPEGLVVPVIKDSDKKGIRQLSSEIVELSKKAREKKLGLDDLQGGTFTISSLGALGGTGFTPIVNAPQVAILGVARLMTEPEWDGEQFMPRKMLPLSLSYDHRVINGADGGRFMLFLTRLLRDIRRFSL